MSSAAPKKENHSHLGGKNKGQASEIAAEKATEKWQKKLNLNEMFKR